MSRLPEEAELLQRGEQEVVHLLPVCRCQSLFYAAVCWGSSIGAANTNQLNKLIRKAGSVIGCKMDTVEAVVERRMAEQTAIYPGEP